MDQFIDSIFLQDIVNFFIFDSSDIQYSVAWKDLPKQKHDYYSLSPNLHNNWLPYSW